MQKFILAAIAATFVAAEQAAVPEADNKTDEDALYYSRHSYVGHPGYGYGYGHPYGYHGYGHPYGYHGYGYGHAGYGYGHPAFYDNEAKDNKSEEDAIFYRRYGYYPGYHGYHGYGYGHHGFGYGYGHPYGYGHGYGYGHPAFYDNEADNKTDEDAIFYRRYGYYPRYHGYHGYGYGHPYGYGHGYYGHPAFYDNEAKEAGNKTEEDALVFYRRYGYYPTWYHGAHRTVTTHVYGNKSEKKQQ